MRHLKTYDIFEKLATDDNGRVITVYHGSDIKFDKFELGKKGRNHTVFYIEEIERGAFFFAENKAEAKKFGKYVYSVRLDIKKLDNWREPGAMRQEVFDMLMSKHRHSIPYSMSDYWQMIDDKDIRNDIISLGIDGIKSYEFDPDGGDDPILTWIVFDPNQIKIIKVE